MLGPGNVLGAGRSESGSQKVLFYQPHKQAPLHNPKHPLCQKWVFLAFPSGFVTCFIVMQGAISQRSGFPHGKMQISFLVEDS